MSNDGAEQISLFRFHIKNRRFDEGTLRVLESILVSKDVKSFLDVCSSLKRFMRSEFSCVLHEIARKSFHQKLLILDFFVRAFAMAGDVESCLALRYEALLLRDFQSVSFQGLQVSHMEWLSFAENSFEKGYHSIARQACENALSCLRRDHLACPVKDKTFEKDKIMKKITELKDLAVASAASCSVQAQTADYLKKRLVEKSKQHSSGKEACCASTLFRNGIKKQNIRKLQQSISLRPGGLAAHGYNGSGNS